MKVSLLLFFVICFTCSHSQETEMEEGPYEFSIIKPNPSAAVSQHKDDLELTLLIDSIQLHDKTIFPKFRKTIKMSFESDYLQVNDSLYLKIFIARNQEYGVKFYTWKWDYLKKRKDGFYSMGISHPEIMNYNRGLNSLDVIGHGYGIEGSRGYIMYYYRYNLQ